MIVCKMLYFWDRFYHTVSENIRNAEACDWLSGPRVIKVPLVPLTPPSAPSEDFHSFIMGTILRALSFLALLCLAEAKQKDFYSFKLVNSRGRLVSLEKYRGSVSLEKSALMLQA